MRWLHSAGAVLLSWGLGLAHAAGPSQVARADRHLWPESVQTQAGFNSASRAYLLVYRQVLAEWAKLSDAELQSQVQTKSLNRSSVDLWLQQQWTDSLNNYQVAAKTCEAQADWTCKALPTVKQQPASVDVPQKLALWQANLTEFVRAYQREQLRLAALFPKVSSEIARFEPQELTGSELADRQFLLSFDDGPTAAASHTDATLAMLQAQHKTATFFVLGANLSQRLLKTSPAAVQTLYQGQCLASHGWEHQSHAKWEQWQDSVSRTQALLQQSFEAKQVLPLFRPPYGQRKADSGRFFAQQQLRVALWNLDSQDWNNGVKANDVLDRMFSLMLIKRRGILLFHDIHPKAVVALPQLFSELGEAVEWLPCQAWPKP